MRAQGDIKETYSGVPLPSRLAFSLLKSMEREEGWGREGREEGGGEKVEEWGRVETVSVVGEMGEG